MWLIGDLLYYSLLLSLCLSHPHTHTHTLTHTHTHPSSRSLIASPRQLQWTASECVQILHSFGGSMIVTSSLSLSLPPFSPLWHTVYYDSLYLSHTLSLSISLTHSLSLSLSHTLSLSVMCVCVLYTVVSHLKRGTHRQCWLQNHSHSIHPASTSGTSKPLIALLHITHKCEKCENSYIYTLHIIL